MPDFGSHNNADDWSIAKYQTPIKIMILAGEASGDKHGGALARSLRKLYPDFKIEMFGAGGVEMREAGVETLVDARDVAVIGIPEIAQAIGKLYRAYRTLVNAARSRRPNIVVLIDWPDFNLRFAKRASRDGLKIVYYISPQVWAWKRYRVRSISRYVHKMLVILPFEEEFYRNHGIQVEYVGHPLVDEVRPECDRGAFTARHNLRADSPIIALLPGSREREIHYHLPIMLEAASRLSDMSRSGEVPLQGPQFAVPLASTADLSQVQRIIDESPIRAIPIERDTYSTLAHSEVAVVASGTATVEAALLGTPMVIIYRASEINWRLVRPLIHLDTFGMVNLIAGRRIVPELIQHDATAENIVREVTFILKDPQRRDQMKQDLSEVCAKLGAGKASDRAARAVIESHLSSNSE